MRHLTVQQVSASLDGALSGVSLELVVRHLAGCHECRERHARLTKQDDSLRRLLACELPEVCFEDMLARLAVVLDAEARGQVPPEHALPPELPPLEPEPAPSREMFRPSAAAHVESPPTEAERKQRAAEALKAAETTAMQALEDLFRERRAQAPAPPAPAEPPVAVPVEPVVLTPEPVVAVPVEPVVVTPEPVVVTPEPVVVAPEPVVAVPVEPVFVAPVPVTVEPVFVEPLALESVSDSIGPVPAAADAAAVPPLALETVSDAIGQAPVAADPVFVEPAGEPVAETPVPAPVEIEPADDPAAKSPASEPVTAQPVTAEPVAVEPAVADAVAEALEARAPVHGVKSVAPAPPVPSAPEPVASPRPEPVRAGAAQPATVPAREPAAMWPGTPASEPHREHRRAPQPARKPAADDAGRSRTPSRHDRRRTTRRPRGRHVAFAVAGVVVALAALVGSGYLPAVIRVPVPELPAPRLPRIEVVRVPIGKGEPSRPGPADGAAGSRPEVARETAIASTRNDAPVVVAVPAEPPEAGGARNEAHDPAPAAQSPAASARPAPAVSSPASGLPVPAPRIVAPARPAPKPAAPVKARPAAPAVRVAEPPADDGANWPLLCGMVVDETGAPVAGARISLADLELAARTDRRGRFCIAAPPGDRTLSVIASGFAGSRRVVSLGSAGLEVSIALVPASPAP